MQIGDPRLHRAAQATACLSRAGVPRGEAEGLRASCRRNLKLRHYPNRHLRTVQNAQLRRRQEAHRLAQADEALIRDHGAEVLLGVGAASAKPRPSREYFPKGVAARLCTLTQTV